MYDADDDDSRAAACCVHLSHARNFGFIAFAARSRDRFRSPPYVCVTVSNGASKLGTTYLQYRICPSHLFACVRASGFRDSVQYAASTCWAEECSLLLDVDSFGS